MTVLEREMITKNHNFSLLLYFTTVIINNQHQHHNHFIILLFYMVLSSLKLQFVFLFPFSFNATFLKKSYYYVFSSVYINNKLKQLRIKCLLFCLISFTLVPLHYINRRIISPSFKCIAVDCSVLLMLNHQNEKSEMIGVLNLRQPSAFNVITYVAESSI